MPLSPAELDTQINGLVPVPRFGSGPLARRHLGDLKYLNQIIGIIRILIVYTQARGYRGAKPTIIMMDE